MSIQRRVRVSVGIVIGAAVMSAGVGEALSTGQDSMTVRDALKRASSWSAPKTRVYVVAQVGPRDRAIGDNAVTQLHLALPARPGSGNQRSELLARFSKLAHDMGVKFSTSLASPPQRRTKDSVRRAHVAGTIKRAGEPTDWRTTYSFTPSVSLGAAAIVVPPLSGHGLMRAAALVTSQKLNDTPEKLKVGTWETRRGQTLDAKRSLSELEEALIAVEVSPSGTHH